MKTIRTETTADHEVVRQVNVEAFDKREYEAKLVEGIRQSDSFIDSLSLVAESAQGIIGHALFSKASIVVGDTNHEVIVLAPIAVLPAFQKQGVGKKLIEEGLTRSRQLGFPGVLLIGHPEYYPRFGFRPASTFGLVLKQIEVPDDVFMAVELTDGALHALQGGELRYPAAFFDN
ncbi:GNAT family N-acetyltransferase [Paenibacillus sp. CF384]|uniref:GNAT family N-acetyltransferase n=1 Tax=Paenibacillus sp. CF384 TaxID=1884382 RepID=UPI0008974B1E|nr:N-acetyltransferase [Paenibacillus sp. CF384]SDW54264.1 Predicted N-acetyltransferase YhbS [Paenibacillus sp. CF384]